MIAGLQVNMSLLSSIRNRFLFGTLAFISVLLIIWQRPTPINDVFSKLHHPSVAPPSENSAKSTAQSTAHASEKLPQGTSMVTQLLLSISTVSQYFLDYPLPASEFGKMGERLQILRDWIETDQTLSDDMMDDEVAALRNSIDRTALSLFPFLRNPSRSSDAQGLSNLRQRIKPGSKGIVISSGKGTFRYACHLVSNLRNVLASTLPIEIVYAGDEDLPAAYRDFITGLGNDIHTVDILTVVDDKTLDLKNGGWAIKPFATMASKYEQVMVLDADAVLLQKPEAIFEKHKGYEDTGALFFHDRLLWQGAFKERHEWWEEQLAHHTPSKALSKSLVYNDGYAEECDSGMVVIDKSRLQILLGLLHVCWQNTKIVRDEWTYKRGYGDKESWWFGMELSGAEYTFESHYGAVLGHTQFMDNTTKVCGFTIAHADESNRLLWYNGSLLKNKAVNATAFDIPTHWMVDGVWEKGATKPDMSCMRENEVRDTTSDERDIVSRSVDRARDIDRRIEELGLV